MSAVFDVDFVPERVSVPQVREFMAPGWREHLSTGGGLAGSGYNLPAAPYRLSPHPGNGDPLKRARALLDARDVTAAIVNPGNAGGLSGISNAMMAAEIARATNDFVLARWPAADGRLRVSIVVSPRDGRLAADEVRRRAGDERIAQVVLAFPPVLLGDRSLYPLFEAAEGARLPVSLQAGGGFVGANAGPASVGHPTSLWEYRISSAYGAIPHLLSLVSEGVFTRFPALRVVFSGFGIGWLPSLLWRMDSGVDHVARADRVARLDRRPSEVVNEHISFTTVGLEVAPEIEDLIGRRARTLLLFGSGESGEEQPWPLGVSDLDRAMLDNADALFAGDALSRADPAPPAAETPRRRR